jgi:hypothetical protein
MECALSCWETGVFVKKDFRDAYYKPKYLILISDKHSSILTYNAGINSTYAFSRIFRRRLQGGR